VRFKTVERLRQGGVFLRAEWECDRPGRKVSYRLARGGESVADAHGVSSWAFHAAPVDAVGFRYVYASCNGFSAAKLLAHHKEPYAMWSRMAAAHKSTPHHLLAMGGDQIYADAVWEQPWMREFSLLGGREAERAAVTSGMEEAVDGFYEGLYLSQWGRPEVAAMMARIPSIMMWDDHDIFDGWGSFTPEQQASPVFQRIFAAAKRAFRLFQLRACPAKALWDDRGEAFDYALEIAGTTFLVMDHRGRRTRERVMSPEQWDRFTRWLAGFEGRRLFVMTGVPVVYRRFTAVEAIMAATPWQEELEDDLLDHWSARPHQRERVKFIYQLLRRQEAIKQLPGADAPQWVFLSGDVHVGGAGVVWEEVRDVGVYQIISSGIAHPPPSAIQWKAIQLTSSDEPEVLGDGDLKAELLVPTGAANNYLRTRNFVLAEVGTDQRLWFEWQCEDGQKPVFSI